MVSRTGDVGDLGYTGGFRVRSRSWPNSFRRICNFH
jgi:hypothetical protein